MGILSDGYRQWNSPVIGAYLLWRFALGYRDGSNGEPAPLLLMCIVSVLLRGRVYFDAVDYARNLHGYVRKLVRLNKGDKLEHMHDRVMRKLPYTIRCVDFAASRCLLNWVPQKAALAPMEWVTEDGAKRPYPKSVQKLGAQAEKIGVWMGQMTISEVAFSLGVKF